MTNSKRHKHANIMIAFANDPSIQIEQKFPDRAGWHTVELGYPAWYEKFEYRIKPKPHIHQELMDAFAADPSLKFQFVAPIDSQWIDVDGRPCWSTHIKYRIKPKARAKVKLWQWICADGFDVVLSSVFYKDAERACASLGYGKANVKKAPWTEIEVYEDTGELV